MPPVSKLRAATMGPDLQADVSLWDVVLFAALNPGTIAAAFSVGRRADQPAKLLIAAFAGGIAGSAVLYLAALLHLWHASTLARASAGVFIASMVFGLLYAALGYRTRR